MSTAEALLLGFVALLQTGLTLGAIVVLALVVKGWR